MQFKDINDALCCTNKNSKVYFYENGTIGCIDRQELESIKVYLEEDTKYFYDDDGIYIDTSKWKLFDKEECAIDELRKIDYICNFDETTITYYLSYLINAIKNLKTLYLVRKSNKGYFVDKVNILNLYYNYSTQKWKLLLSSVDLYYKCAWNADNSLGLKLFFSEDNAIKKCLELRGFHE